MNLLLIEDDQQLAAEIAAPLCAQGFEVTRIADGAAGLEAATAGSYDLVITDRMLPKLEGREIVRALRARGEIVVQVLPGHEHEQQEFECDRQLAKQGAAWVLGPLRGDH